MTTSLANISKAKRALEAATDLNDVLQIRDQAKAIETYVKAARETLAVSNQASEIKVRAERKAGEMISKMEKAKPGPKDNSHGAKQLSKREQLESIGVGKDQSSRLQSMAAVPDDRFEELADAERATSEEREITSRSIQEAAKKPHVTNNSCNNDWYTPCDFIEAARKAMGSIDLDPASSRVAQETVQAKKFYSIDDDGLTHKWRGNVWLNPPYATGLVEKFTSKLAAHIESGDVKQAVLLVNNSTETIWFQDTASLASMMCMPQSRIKFNDSTGKPANSPLQGQVILYFGKRLTAFEKSFARFGICWRR